jgi:hypothetical protein
MSAYAEFEDEKLPEIACLICYEHHDSMKSLPICDHIYCTNCLTLYIQNLIDTSQINSIVCPSCNLLLERELILTLISEAYLEKYDRFTLRENLLNNPYARFCPQPNCDGYDLGNLNKRKLVCNVCAFAYCFFCSEPFHGNSRCSKPVDDDFERWVASNNVKFCPKCKRRVEKRGGCPKMTCVCGHNWCWRCGGNPHGPNHEIRCLIGPDIWNVRKKIILMMIFAPVLIFFIPALIIVVIVDMMNEGEENWWILRNRFYFYPLLVVLSPGIEVIAIGVYIIVVSALIAKNFSHRHTFWGVLVFLLAVGPVAGFAVICVAASIVISFLSCVAGIVLFAVRQVGFFTGKSSTSSNFYPQVFD